ncbi:MAG: hypothetical protein FWC17_00060 [Treponema sp.]|nr:hypothetical protein [Treponema sp.]
MSNIKKKLRRELNKKTPDQNITVSQESNALKDKAVFLGWITGLLLFISLLWILTTPLQTRYLLRTVNNVLINNNDSRRLVSHINAKPAKADLLGYWFLMLNSSDRMFVFTVFQDGILVPLGAVLNDEGKVYDVIPLSAHAVRIFNKLPESVLRIYIQRIENSSKDIFRGGRQ